MRTNNHDEVHAPTSTTLITESNDIEEPELMECNPSSQQKSRGQRKKKRLTCIYVSTSTVVGLLVVVIVVAVMKRNQDLQKEVDVSQDETLQMDRKLRIQQLVENWTSEEWRWSMFNDDISPQSIVLS
jgi:hypothetical protein